MKSEKFNVVPVKSSEITPEQVYLSRRKFMKVAGAALGGAASAACLCPSRGNTDRSRG